MATAAPTAHSRVVGGSTAKRRMACPGSLKGEKQWPQTPTSGYAEIGTMLHNVMAQLLTDPDLEVESFIGFTHIGADGKTYTCTKEHIEDKITPALEALDEIDPDRQMEMFVETEVVFDKKLGAFGTCDVIGKLPGKAVILDWKFGDGNIVSAEENAQLMYYAAAAMKTPKLKDLFTGVETVELVIVQPPSIRRWETTIKRLKAFEKELKEAIGIGMRDDAPFKEGPHCKWCAGQEIDPETGLPFCDRMRKPLLNIPKIAVNEEAMEVQFDGGEIFSADSLGTAYMSWVQVIEPIGAAIERVVRRAMESGVDVPFVRLEPKRATRKWVDEQKAEEDLVALLQETIDHDDQIDNIILKPAELKTPAQMEKELKTLKLELPEGLVAAVSSGDKLVIDPTKTPDQCLNGNLKDALKV